MVRGNGILRLVDNVAIDSTDPAVRGQDSGRIKLVGNDITALRDFGMQLDGSSSADYQSGTLIATEFDAVWLSGNARLNYRGGTIGRGGQAKDSPNHVDVRIDGKSELHVFAISPTFADNHIQGSFRDGTAINLRVATSENASIVLHDLLEFDFNSDQSLDASDIDQLGNAIRGHLDPAPMKFDLNESQTVDSEDLRILIEDVLGVNAGDANLDSRFDSADLVQVFQFARIENATWGSGDWNQDGRFDSSDLVVAFQTGDYGRSVAATQAVPEPSGAQFGLIAFMTIIVITSANRNTAPRPGGDTSVPNRASIWIS